MGYRFSVHGWTNQIFWGLTVLTAPVAVVIAFQLGSNLNMVEGQYFVFSFGLILLNACLWAKVVEWLVQRERRMKRILKDRQSWEEALSAGEAPPDWQIAYSELCYCRTIIQQRISDEPTQVFWQRRMKIVSNLISMLEHRHDKVPSTELSPEIQEQLVQNHPLLQAEKPLVKPAPAGPEHQVRVQGYVARLKARTEAR